MERSSPDSASPGKSCGRLFDLRMPPRYRYAHAMASVHKTDLGLLIVRVGVGASFMGHGYGKVMGGPEKWAKLGGAMKVIGIDFLPTFWGACGAFAEFFGGLALALGVVFTPAAAAMAFTMFVAMMVHIDKGDGFSGWNHAFEAMVLFVGLALIGPGGYTVHRLRK